MYKNTVLCLDFSLKSSLLTCIEHLIEMDDHLTHYVTEAEKINFWIIIVNKTQ